jgi:hypothetical protein
MQHLVSTSSTYYTQLHFQPPQLGTINGSGSETWSVPVSNLSQKPGVWIICNKKKLGIWMPITFPIHARRCTLIMEVTSTSEKNISNFLPGDTVQHPIRQSPSFLLLQELQISPGKTLSHLHKYDICNSIIFIILTTLSVLSRICCAEISWCKDTSVINMVYTKRSTSYKHKLRIL